MKAHVVRIGNSRGIRIPKSVIVRCQLHGAVDLIVQQRQLLIRPAKARTGWDQAFEQMHRHGGDQLLDPESLPSSEWDRKDWTW
jgi:antitoxin MazE